MLILRRRRGQVIFIGDTGEIQIKILSHDADIVRIGVIAPSHISVYREELFQSMQQPSVQRGIAKC